MKPRSQKQRNRAWTIFELFVVIAIFVFLVAMLLPVLAATHKRSSRIDCVANLRQIGDAWGIWAGNHKNQYPMSFSGRTNVAEFFQVMSNQFVSPKILICPSDRRHLPATNFQNDFNNSHVNYFINPDASQSYPQEIMSGDDNLAIDGVPVNSGLVALPSPSAVSWTAARHINVGNILFADGSVSEFSITGLQSSLALSTNGTPITNVRLAIP